MIYKHNTHYYFGLTRHTLQKIPQWIHIIPQNISVIGGRKLRKNRLIKKFWKWYSKNVFQHQFPYQGFLYELRKRDETGFWKQYKNG